MINAMMIQLYQPLNFMGMVYREIKQAVIDIEKMFDAARRASRRSRTRPAPSRCVVTAGNVRFDERALRLRSRAADPQGRQLRGAGRQDGRDRRALGRRQVDHLAAAVPLLRRHRAAAS